MNPKTVNLKCKRDEPMPFLDEVFDPFCSIIKDKAALNILCQAIAFKSFPAAGLMLLPLFSGPHRENMFKMIAGLTDKPVEALQGMPLKSVLASMPFDDLQYMVEWLSSLYNTARELQRVQS